MNINIRRKDLSGIGTEMKKKRLVRHRQQNEEKKRIEKHKSHSLTATPDFDIFTNSTKRT